MPCHAVILKRPYLDAILAGTKTIESRITRTAQPPYRAVTPGERLFLKVSAGPWMATALAGHIEFHNDLTPAKVDALRDRYRPTVGGDDAYWAGKRDCRYATFVTLMGVEPLDVGPPYARSLKAWHVVDDRLNPLREVTITAGAIRNRYAMFPENPTSPRRSDLSRPASMCLILPDDTAITTTLARGRMLRWRGWGRFYEAHGVKPGDRLRFVALGGGRYRVAIVRT